MLHLVPGSLVPGLQAAGTSSHFLFTHCKHHVVLCPPVRLFSLHSSDFSHFSVSLSVNAPHFSDFPAQISSAHRSSQRREDNVPITRGFFSCFSSFVVTLWEPRCSDSWTQCYRQANSTTTAAVVIRGMGRSQSPGEGT